MTEGASQENNRSAALEALLFVHGEPLSLKKIAKMLAVKESEAEALLNELEGRLAAPERGVTLVRQGDMVQLATKPEFGGIVEQFVKSELAEELTPASVETLAIIAYFGPLSRARIEYQRGVNSIFILRSLLLRGLVERFPDPERANSYLYRPSFELLRHLGIAAQGELPDHGKFQSLMKTFEGQETLSQPQ